MNKIAESVEELLKAYLDGKIIVYKESEGWQKKDDFHFPSINKGEIENKKWSIKDPAININGFEVPEPYRGNMEIGQQYWCFHIPDNYVLNYTWANDVTDKTLIKMGLIHLTKEASELHLKALLSFTRLE